ncbi:MAG: SUMF1/EgtB/PvdO family nonheme iron enzyme [Phycisphaerae bacterium]|nr:SUMF1/EgtB/PvdO family nonheme iron enzyme [Phycisphaerae bacterium]
MEQSADNSYISDYARRFMIVVGANSYEAPLLALKTPVADACRIFHLLRDQFGFDGCLLAEREEVRKYEAELGGNQTLESCIEGDGTRADIEQAIWNLTQKSRPEDLFLFYYGGHGTEEQGLGFLLPYGTALNRYDTYLMYPALFGALEALPCLHKLLFFDCCFSGIVTRDICKVLGEAALAGGGAGNQGEVPRILLEPTMASFASTDAFNVAPDQFHTWYDESSGRWSSYSPFGDTLATILQEMPAGTSLIPAEIHGKIYHGVRNRIDTVRAVNGRQVPLQPVARIVGTSTIFLNKLGPRGDPSRIASKPRTVVPVNKAERILLETKYLPVCHVQKDYRASIEITGGVPPLHVEAEGLPRGLDMSASGEVYGRVDTDVAFAGGCLHVFVLCATDGKGEQLRERLAIPIIDPDVYVAVPAGEFQFGYSPSARRTQTLNNMQVSAQVREDLAEHLPAGAVTLPLFFIRRHPLTNNDWRAFVEQSSHPGVSSQWKALDDVGFWRREGELPVTGLTGRDVEAFCDWHNTRLPSRFQWEKAARGTDGRLFPWGDDFLPHLCTCVEQHRGAYRPETVRSNPSFFVTRVDQHPQGRSPYGVEDLVGNTWELTGHVLWDETNQPCFARMGGSAADGGANLTTCFGCRLRHAIPGHLDVNQGRIRLAPRPLPPLTGFRDVIELAQAPPFQQGFVKLKKATLRLDWAPDVFSEWDAYLARYQVSNWEYAEFVRESGHDRPSHWSNHDEWFFPFHLRFHPVVNVTWQDVQAFCRWKSAKLGVRCQPMNVSLWRLAVHQPHPERGDRPQKYPWGDEYNEGLCNHPPSGYGGTIAVFELPKGRAVCGAWNLVGNAAEWVSPNQTAGGSWLHGIQSPGDFITPNAGAGPAVGFRYFTWDPPVKNKNG